MPVEELRYTIPNDGQGNIGSEVDLFLTYQPNTADPAGPALVTAATGTFDTLDSGGAIIDRDTVLQIDAPNALEGNDNELYIVSPGVNSPYLDFNGIAFEISNTADSNDGAGNVGFYAASADGSGSTLYSDDSDNELFASRVTEAPACFLAGTRLRTPAGEVAVEHLAAGDLLITAAGKSVPVIWAGAWQVDLGTHRKPHTAQPIRIACGALGTCTPHRDLYLSPDHALYIAGMLVPAHLLCNNETITQPDRLGAVTYYHIQVEPHDILLAEGAPAESYLDLGANGFSKPGEAPRSWEDACAPLLLTGPRLQAIRQGLAAVAKQRGAGAAVLQGGLMATA